MSGDQPTWGDYRTHHGRLQETSLEDYKSHHEKIENHINERLQDMITRHITEDIKSIMEDYKNIMGRLQYMSWKDYKNIMVRTQDTSLF